MPTTPARRFTTTTRRASASNGDGGQPHKGIFYWPRRRQVTACFASLFMTGSKNSVTQKFHLTAKQARVLHLVTECHGDKQIAGKIGISIRTVRDHLLALHRKFGTTTTRTQLIAAWFGLITDGVIAKDVAVLDAAHGPGWSEQQWAKYQQETGAPTNAIAQLAFIERQIGRLEVLRMRTTRQK